MDFSTVLSKILLLFAIIIVGYAANKIGLIDRDISRKLSNIVLNITLPAMVIASVLTSTSDLGLGKIFTTLIISLIVHGLLILVALFLPKLLKVPEKSVGAYRFAIVFGNVGFVGYPVAITLYGNEGLFYAAMFNIVFNILVFTVGRMFVSGNISKEDITWKMFVTPCTVSSVVALILAVFQVRLPTIGEGFEILGNFTTPAALLILGSSLADIPIKSVLGSPKMYIIAAWRLLLFPLILIAVLGLVIESEIVVGISVIITGMPVATNGTMLCYSYGGDEKCMSQLTFITTVLSIITIPVLSLFL